MAALKGPSVAAERLKAFIGHDVFVRLAEGEPLVGKLLDCYPLGGAYFLALDLGKEDRLVQTTFVLELRRLT